MATPTTRSRQVLDPATLERELAPLRKINDKAPTLSRGEGAEASHCNQSVGRWQKTVAVPRQRLGMDQFARLLFCKTRIVSDLSRPFVAKREKLGILLRADLGTAEILCHVTA